MSKVIDTPQKLDHVAKQLSCAGVIAFDTEFIRESTFFPIVEIIQVATEADAWIVDVRAFADPKRLAGQKKTPDALRPLMDVFADKRVLKVGHALQGDQECLLTSFGVIASPGIDTAVAASLCGYGDGIGLGNLLNAALEVSIKKGNARTDWSARPLPPQLVEYALADVTYLVVLWKKLEVEISRLERRDWAFELAARFEDPAVYEPSAEVIAGRLSSGGRLDRKAYTALLGLVRWREERSRQLNLPRRWIADDHVLTDIARVRPKDIQHLGSFRGINKGEIKASGQMLLDVLREAEKPGSAALQPPREKREKPPGDGESQSMELLKCYVNILAGHHKIAARHLLLSEQLLPIIRSQAQTAEDLVCEGLMSARAGGLIGGEIVDLLRGRRALSVSGGRVNLIDLLKS